MPVMSVDNVFMYICNPAMYVCIAAMYICMCWMHPWKFGLQIYKAICIQIPVVTS